MMITWSYDWLNPVGALLIGCANKFDQKSGHIIVIPQ